MVVVAQSRSVVRGPRAVTTGPPSIVPRGTAITMMAPLAASTSGNLATGVLPWNSAIDVDMCGDQINPVSANPARETTADAPSPKGSIAAPKAVTMPMVVGHNGVEQGGRGRARSHRAGDDGEQ